MTPNEIPLINLSDQGIENWEEFQRFCCLNFKEWEVPEREANWLDLSELDRLKYTAYFLTMRLAQLDTKLLHQYEVARFDPAKN